MNGKENLYHEIKIVIYTIFSILSKKRGPYQQYYESFLVHIFLNKQFSQSGF